MNVNGTTPVDVGPKSMDTFKHLWAETDSPTDNVLQDCSRIQTSTSWQRIARRTSRSKRHFLDIYKHANMQQFQGIQD